MLHNDKEETMESTHAEGRWPRHQEKQVNVGETERKASMVGGAALALSGLTTMAKKHPLPGLAMMVAGGLFFYRGKTGHCDVYQAAGIDTAHNGEAGIRIEKVVTINRPREEVFDYWRHLENLPRFMEHLESVQVTGEKSTHWKAHGPGGVTMEWDAETTEEVEGQYIGWHSVGEAKLPNQGKVEFFEAPGNRGTEVKVAIDYFPPGGAAGRAAAKLTRALTAQQLEEDLKRLKQILETGEVATAQMTRH
jgi:uncharacterized membrane protein